MAKMYNLKNRSSSVVVYSLENGTRRTFQPGEIKSVSENELRELSYQSGGAELITHYFMIIDAQAVQELGMKVEPEYFMDEKAAIELIKNGSLDAWLDCLDFAPEGVIQLIKDLSVAVPLNDVAKREALLKKTGFDVTAAINNKKAEEAEQTEAATDTAAPVRRVQTATTESQSTSGRRTTPPKYKVVG